VSSYSLASLQAAFIFPKAGCNSHKSLECWPFLNVLFILLQACGKEHTVYTVRFRTGYGRGCGLDVPGAGVQASRRTPRRGHQELRLSRDLCLIIMLAVSENFICFSSLV